MAKPDPFEDMDEDELIEEVIIPFLLTQLVSPRRLAPSLPEREQEAELEIARPEEKPEPEELPTEAALAPERPLRERKPAPAEFPDLLEEIFRKLFGPPRKGA